MKRRSGTPGQSWTGAATRHGCGHRGLARVRLRARARRRGGARHDVPRQHVPGGELRLERAVRAARGRRAVGGARADVRHAARRGRRRRSATASPAGCSASRSSGSGLLTARRRDRRAAARRGCSPSASPNDAVAAQQRRLATFLLRFFLPQVLLYACGAIATALLYARRRFSITAAAPIGNTVVMVACLDRLPNRGRSAIRRSTLPTRERLLLAIAGTGGVIAFVGDPRASRPAQSGFSLRPRWLGRHAGLARLLRLSGWGVLLNANAGIAPRRRDHRRQRGRRRCRRVPGRVRVLPRAVRRPRPADPHRDPPGARARGGGRGPAPRSPRRSARRARPHGVSRRAGVGRAGRARVADDARWSRSERAADRRASCLPRASRRSRSGCIRTARSCCFARGLLRARRQPHARDRRDRVRAASASRRWSARAR